MNFERSGKAERERLETEEGVMEGFDDDEPVGDGELVYEGFSEFPEDEVFLGDWEQSLEKLSGIGAKRLEGKRFAWGLEWTNYERQVYDVTLIPLEQTLQRQGWSKGRRVALRRLRHEPQTVGCMTEQDLRAATAVRAVRGYYGMEYSLDVSQALLALVGHPFLFRMDDGRRVDLVEDEPRLVVSSGRSEWLLYLTNVPYGETHPQLLLREDPENVLKLTHFEERHLRMARILGDSGLKVPFSAREKLLKTLGILSSFVTIHSDLAGIDSALEMVLADPGIYVRLYLVEEGLEVEVEVRPLGKGSTVCRPGRGGVNLFGILNGRRVQTVRSLEAELDAFSDLQSACPALSEGEQLAPERWSLPDPALALEFLVQLQALGETVRVEWVRGEPFSVLSPDFSSMPSLSLSVRDDRDWFAVSGSLKVNEKLVLDMKSLLEGLDYGYGRFIFLQDGSFLALTKALKRQLEVLRGLGEPKGEELRVAPAAVGLLEDVGAESSSSGWREKAHLVAEAASLSPELPPGFRGELRDYQMEGYRWLCRLAHWGGGACLADDMGLGKTVQALALLAARSSGPSLVVAPTSVCQNWAREAARFVPSLKVRELASGDREEALSGLGVRDLVLVSYGLLQSESRRLSAIPWHTIVLDEAQAIKNMGTKRSAAAMKLKGNFKVATTGTPIENRLSELWNLFRFLNPHYLGSFESFSRRFITPIERDKNEAARQLLKRLIQPFILRRTKTQVLEELPPKTEVTLRVPLKERERAFYEALRRSVVEQLQEVGEDDRMHIFAALMKLRRACCSTSLFSPECAAPSAKMEAFQDILTELRENGHRALVFSQFVDHLSLLRAWLDEEKIPYQYLDGSTPVRERQRRVDAFQGGEGDCFLISLRAGGTGLNLTGADFVIHMDPWWNPAVEDQASDRSHRIGQTRPVTVYRIVAKDTVEEKIVDLHAHKRALAEGLLDETGGAFDASEMLRLIFEETGNDSM
ncbi:MAG: DEAD/DEAH box helicase [Fretibacterium sp.]|nr:DEAD/DEAH box helicase [Fretibacterium sp.]